MATFQHPDNNPLLAAKVFVNEAGSTFANVIRGLLQDNARRMVEVAGVADMTDSTTGTASTDTVVMTIPTAAFDGSASGASPATAFNTEMNIFEDIGVEFGDWMNNVRVRLGLPQITWATGSGTSGTLEAAAGAVAGLDTTNGATAIDFLTGVAAMTAVRNNFATMLRAVNELAAAMGESVLTESTERGTPSATYALVAVADATAGTGPSAGDTSISDTVADAFLAALVNNVATLALKFNAMVTGSGLPADLTVSALTTGSSDGDTLATAGAAFTAYDDVATASAPVAGWNTAVGVIEDNFADLALRTNLLLARYNFTLMTDSTTGTANTALALIDDTQTSVDGTGDNSLSEASGTVGRGKIDANVATLIVEINKLVPFFGIVALTDNFGGTASVASPPVLVPIGDGTGVDNGAAATGLETLVDIDPYLDRVVDAQLTIAAKLAEMTGTTPGITKPLKAIAGL